MKKILSIIMSVALIMSLSVSAMAAGPLEVSSYQEAYEIAAAINDNMTYDLENQRFEFDAESAISQGLSENIAYQIESNVSTMSTDESATLNEKMEEAQPRSIIATVAAFLVGAGLSWLADKLLDYGAEKFCDSYGDYNDIAATACEMLGY